MPRINEIKESKYKLDTSSKKIEQTPIKEISPNRNNEFESKNKLEYIAENLTNNDYELRYDLVYTEQLLKEIDHNQREIVFTAHDFNEKQIKTKEIAELIEINKNDEEVFIKEFQFIEENQNNWKSSDRDADLIEKNQNLEIINKWELQYTEPNRNDFSIPEKELTYIEKNQNNEFIPKKELQYIEKNQNFNVITPYLPELIHENMNQDYTIKKFPSFIEENQNNEFIPKRELTYIEENQNKDIILTKGLEGTWTEDFKKNQLIEANNRYLSSFFHARDAWEKIAGTPERLLEKLKEKGDQILDDVNVAGAKIITNLESYYTNTVDRVIDSILKDPIGVISNPEQTLQYIKEGIDDSVNQSINLVNEYVIGSWNTFTGIANNFLPENKKIKKLDPIQNIKKGSKKDEEDTIFGEILLKEGPSQGSTLVFSEKEGVFGFEAVPDIFCDIKIEPYIYKVSSDIDTTINTNIPSSKIYEKIKNEQTGLYELKDQENGNDKTEFIYAPPPYPIEQLGEFMIQDFTVTDLQFSFQEPYNLGSYGSVPLVANMILPSTMTIEFVADANLLTHKWLLALEEYMYGSKLDPNVMRPYKMCCYKITTYTTTFYGETIYARTYIAYPTTKFSESFKGTGNVKIISTDWAIVGMLEYTPMQEDTKIKAVWDDNTIKKTGDRNILGGSVNYLHGKAEVLNKETVDKFTDNFIKDSMDDKYIVIGFASFISSPSYANNQIPYDSTIDSTILKDRLKGCDEIAKKRVENYKKTLTDKGIKEENIALIIGSSDGIPAYNDLAKEIRKATGDYYKDGIYAYEEGDNTITDEALYDKPSIKANRRVDVLKLSELLKKDIGKNFLKEYYKIHESLFTNNKEDEIKIWNKIKDKPLERTDR